MEAHTEFMKRAIDLAKISATLGDYAVGAVIVKENTILAEGTTNLKREHNPTAHAEIVAIRAACTKFSSRFLEGCKLYSTHEPCPMCASAAIWARMEGIVFGASIEDANLKSNQKFTWMQINLSCQEVLAKGEPHLDLVQGFLREECLKLFELSR